MFNCTHLIHLSQRIRRSLWSYNVHVQCTYSICTVFITMNFFRYNWTSHISWGEEECISHRICTGYPIRHKHGLHGQTSCDAYIPSHIGKTFDLMQSCLIQLTSKYINNMAILCSASWQCFIMLQGRWSPKLITCTKRPLKTDWKCGITILRQFFVIPW